MSFVLTVYSKNAFREYLLPAVKNAGYDLKIEKELFGLQNDLNLPMECTDGQWVILRPIGLDITYRVDGRPYRNQVIKTMDLLSVKIAGNDWIAIDAKETDQVFFVYRKYRFTGPGELTVGHNGRHTFCFPSNLVSGDHAAIRWNGTGYVVEDTGSTNGTFINGRIIPRNKPVAVQFGDRMDIFGLRILFLAPVIAVNADAAHIAIRESDLQRYKEPPRIRQADTHVSAEREKDLFHRSPRNIPKIETETVEIEAPPAAKESAQQSLLMTVGPSLTMALPMLAGFMISAYAMQMRGGSGGTFMYTGLVTAVGSALIGSVWAAVNMRQTRKKEALAEQKRLLAYRDYLEKKAETIRQMYERNMNSLLAMYPDAQQCLRYGRSSVELWNRNRRHGDFLNERVGLGSLPFQVKIDIPKERFSLVDDALAKKPKEIYGMYRYLKNVPVCVDLYTHKLVGVIGGEGRKGCYAVMHTLAAQIAANTCYTDVKMAFIYDETKDAGRPVWEFARWLPHVWSEDKKTRYVAGNKNDASDVFYELAQILRIRAEEAMEGRAARKGIAKPYYIMFLENVSLLEGELVTKYLYDTSSDYGISTVVMAEAYEDLPNACEYIIENTPFFQGVYNVDDGEEDRTPIRFDAVDSSRLQQFSRRLAGIEVKEEEVGGEIPNVLTFFDMYGVNHPDELNAAERWKRSRTYDSMRALVGQKSGGAECYLDIHEKYHGPHGLVAGTTGSGKSETLQTYMLSLAVNYSPDDIGFFVIDYKGGGMANLFEGLPHLIGQISNLSGNQVRRAMVSIKSENRRRQRIFNEHGVNNINLYTRLYKNNEASEPVPHMFIIIDEFAELKREEPDFMRELISVAQVGRSLGVHLILATQKPSGTVDDNIWSNAKFRLCLRVQDKQDSTDMLHRPDAAYITQAGRCFLQVGNDELFELFQSAWSGAVYDKEAGTSQTSLARMLTVNGKAALVGSHAQVKQKERTKRMWIASLLDAVEQACGRIGAGIAVCAGDRTMGARLLDEVFTVLGQNGTDYAETDYNRHRMLDLIQEYG